MALNTYNMKKYLTTVLLVICALACLRWWREWRACEIASDQVSKYMTEVGLPFEMSRNPANHSVGMFRSTFDYTFTADRTHRVRFIINIFGQYERHTLVE